MFTDRSVGDNKHDSWNSKSNVTIANKSLFYLHLICSGRKFQYHSASRSPLDLYRPLNASKQALYRRQIYAECRRRNGTRAAAAAASAAAAAAVAPAGDISQEDRVSSYNNSTQLNDCRFLCLDVSPTSAEISQIETYS